MRVTENSLVNQFLYNIQDQYQQMDKLQRWISSGKTILSASDDPVAAGQVLNYVEDIADYEQYIRNMNEGNMWLQVTNSALTQFSDTLQRAQELAVDGADSTKDDAARKIMAEELESIIRHMVMIGNTTIQGQSVFSGTQTTRKPFELTEVDGHVVSVNYVGDTGARQLMISETERLNINTLGSNASDPTKQGLFIDSNRAINVFQTLIRMRDDLNGAQIATGTATGAGPGPGNTTIQDATQAWSTDELAGYRIRITSGTGAGQERVICSNDATTIKVDSAWDTAPDATSQYEIVGNWTNLNGVNTIRDYGTATAGAAATLTDGLQNWTADRWVGYKIEITEGTGAGQTRTILSNTANTITVSQAWTTAPDATSKYRIVALPEHTGNDRMSELDDVLENVTMHMAYLGNKQKRIEDATSAFNYRQSDTVTRLDKLQGVDIAEASMRYYTYQQIFQATASIGAKLLPQSLLNFLR